MAVMRGYWLCRDSGCYRGTVVFVRGTAVLIRDVVLNGGQWLLLGKMVVKRDSGCNGGHCL